MTAEPTAERLPTTAYRTVLRTPHTPPERSTAGATARLGGSRHLLATNRGKTAMSDENLDGIDWHWKVCVDAMDWIGIAPHPDDCGSLVPLYDEIDAYFDGDMRAAYYAIMSGAITFEHIPESNYCNWRIKITGPEWQPRD
jgi:hypothetical protein